MQLLYPSNQSDIHSQQGLHSPQPYPASTHPLAQRLVRKPIGPKLGRLDKRRWGLGTSRAQVIEEGPLLSSQSRSSTSLLLSHDIS